jgi:hypothetical protein
MVTVIKYFVLFYHIILHPQRFAEDGLAPNSFIGLRVSVIFALSSVGIFLVLLYVSGNDLSGKDIFVQERNDVFFMVLVIPMAGWLYLVERRHGVTFIQCLSIFLLIVGASYYMLAVGMFP